MTSVHSGKRARKVVAVFDIGSSSVGVGIAIRTATGVLMPWSLRLSYAYQYDMDYLRFERSMLTALLEAGMRLTSEGIRSAQEKISFDVDELQPVCILASPWFVGGVNENKQSREQGVVVTEAILQDLEKQAQKSFSDSAQTNTWREVMGTETTLIDLHTIRVSLDGYPVTRYVGRKARTIKVTTYGAHAPSRVLNEITQVLQKTLPNHATEFLTSTQVAYKALEQQGLTQGSLVLVELGGEMTTVSLIRNGGLTGTTVFSQGTNHIVRGAFPKANSYSEALGQLTVLAPGPQQQGGPVLPKGLVTSLETWRMSFIQKVTDLTQGVTPPRNVVLICNDVWKEWFMPQLREPWEQPGIRASLGFAVVEQEGIGDTSKNKTNTPDTRIASLLRGILTT